MQPTPVSVNHLSYWFNAEGILMARRVLYRGNDPEVGAVETVVTETVAGTVVRVPWKPDEIDVAHLARGGTLWLSSWGGLAPHMIEVQEP